MREMRMQREAEMRMQREAEMRMQREAEMRMRREAEMRMQREAESVAAQPSPVRAKFVGKSASGGERRDREGAIRGNQWQSVAISGERRDREAQLRAKMATAMQQGGGGAAAGAVKGSRSSYNARDDESAKPKPTALGRSGRSTPAGPARAPKAKVVGPSAEWWR